MRRIIIIGDGMADEPCRELNGLTPLESAETPAIDELASKGRNGLLATVPEGYPPGSDTAHLSLLGYNLHDVYEGRGVLEAAAMGIVIEPGELVLRCNLICIATDGTIKNHSAGHISSEEAAEIVNTLNKELGNEVAEFFPGVGYRQLLKIKGGDKRIFCEAPQDVEGIPSQDVMTLPEVKEARETADFINCLIKQSWEILRTHPVNLRRIAEGKDPANSIWPWSPGSRPRMKTMNELFGISNGYVVSALDLIKGIGIYAGLKPLSVVGATGLHDTNYEGKLQAALNALNSGADFVLLHIEASDEAAHDGNALLKKETIENLDRRIVAPLLEAIKEFHDDVSIALLPDHYTLSRTRRHASTPVPFVILRRGLTPDDVTAYSEKEAEGGVYGLLTGDSFIKEFMK